MNTAEAAKTLKDSMGSAILQEFQCCDQTTLEVRKENLREVLSYLKQAPDPGFEILMDLTGVDYLHPTKHTKIVYWLHNPTNYQRIRIILIAAREEVIPSVSDIWRGADWYERELYDMFGIHFEGHPDMKRILMPDDWVGHPMLRDYPLGEIPVQFKHEAKPKIPSQILSYDKSKQKP